MGLLFSILIQLTTTLYTEYLTSPLNSFTSAMADTTEQQPKLIDETPISPIRPNQARRNSLEDHLKHRPERAELIEKNILPASTAAPGLLAHQKELQKHMLEDKLNDKISRRRSRAARPPPRA